MNFLYILISDEKDYYCEQALISIYTLKIHNPEALVTLVTDKNTNNSLIGNRSRIKDYIDDMVILDTPKAFNKKQKNRFLKTSWRLHVDGDCFYIDNDTIITNNLKFEFGPECELAMVLDMNKETKVKFSIKEYLKATNQEINNSKAFFNSGVMYVKDTPQTKRLYERWNKKWISDLKNYGIDVDQPSFAMVANDFKIKCLDNTYNCQFLFWDGLILIRKAKILHYCTSVGYSSRFPLRDNRVLEQIRKEGINSEIASLINNPIPYIYNGSDIMLKLIVAMHKLPITKIRENVALRHKNVYKFFLFLYKKIGLK